MRKYLLLATVAGCLLANNAMAGELSTDGQSAIINVKANIHGACSISDIQDLDFKDVWVIPEDTSNMASLEMDVDGVVTANSYIPKFTIEGTPLSFKITCPEGSSVSYGIGCADGYTESSGCYFGDGDSYKVKTGVDGSFTPSAGNLSKTVTAGGSLDIPTTAGETTIDEPIFQVTLSY